MGLIVPWWLVMLVVAFWVGAIIGRYLYATLNRYVVVERSDGPLLSIERIGPIPYPSRGRGRFAGSSRAPGWSSASAAISASAPGANNVANAVAPLVGSGALGVNAGIVLATLAIGLGAFTIAAGPSIRSAPTSRSCRCSRH